MEASVSRNADGVGVMYVEDGRVKVDKLVFDPLDNTKTKEEKEQEYAAFCNAYLEGKDRIVIHHRYKTHGKINEINTHPYRILSMDEGDPIDLYMMHNGTLSFGSSVEYSDTYHFVEEVLRPILQGGNHALLHTEGVSKLLSSAVKGSKLVFLDSDNNVTIINESDGKWQEVKDQEGGCWISNTYSIQKKYPAQQYTYYGGWNRNATNTTTKRNPFDIYGDDDYEYPALTYKPNASPPKAPPPKTKPSMSTIIAEAKELGKDTKATVKETFDGQWLRYYFATGEERIISDQEHLNPTEEGKHGDEYWDYKDNVTNRAMLSYGAKVKDTNGLPLLDWDSMSVDECVDILTHHTTSIEDIEDFVRGSSHTKVVQVIDVLSAEVVAFEDERDILLFTDNKGGQEDEELLACAI